MKTKKFDCMKMKRIAQEKIRAAVSGLSPSEEIAYFRTGSEAFEQRVDAARESLKRREKAGRPD